MNVGSLLRSKLVAACALAVLACIGPGLSAGSPILGGILPGPLPLFPSDNWWNLDISGAPVDPGSGAYIAFIGGSSKRLHPDFGGEQSPGSAAIYGFPYIVVDGDQPKIAVDFQYAAESDGYDPAAGRSVPFYPIPDETRTQPHWIEGGQPGNIDLRSQADRHMLIVDRDNRLLYELYNVYYDGTRWQAGSGAFFDMKANGRRTEGWTSADAAGLAILPGLVRYEEVFGSDEIRHAFRATVRATNGYVYPASHRAGSNPQALPMGARLRLKAGIDLSRFRPETQKIFRAMKRYGLIIADNGSDMYVSGTFDTRWDNGALNPDFHTLTADDFEVVRLGYQPPQVAYFPHLAVGGGYATVFSLINTGATAASGSLTLTDALGKPLEAASNETGGLLLSQSGGPVSAAGSTVPVALPSGAASVIAVGPLDSTSPARSGWARLETLGGTVAGVATFRLADGGVLRTIAGVFAAGPMESAVIPVDIDDGRGRFTGLAVANLNEEIISLRLSIFDAGGSPFAEVRPPALNPLPALGQAAAYVHQYMNSAKTFRGTVRIAADGGRKFAAVALQQSAGQFTAIPVVSAH